MSTLLKPLIVAITICAMLSSTQGHWQFMIVSCNCSSTNEKVLRTQLRPERIAPGLYGLTGTFEIGVPMDNTFLFEINLYRSASGSSNFVMTPYRMPKIPVDLMGRTFYEQYAVSDVKNCSDLPLQLRAPVPPQVFHLNKCLIDARKMPKYVRAGFYKTVLKISSPLVVMVVEVVSQVYENVN